MRYSGFRLAIAGSRANNTPCQTPNPPKRRPIHPKPSVLGSLLPNGSARWRPHHRKPRPRRHQTGGIAPCKGATRRRHAGKALRMAQNPHCHRSGGCWREWLPEGPGRGAGARPQYPQTTAAPSPGKFRMQFPHDMDRCTLKNRRISTIGLQHLKYTQGNCMRN